MTFYLRLINLDRWQANANTSVSASTVWKQNKRFAVSSLVSVGTVTVWRWQFIPPIAISPQRNVLQHLLWLPFNLFLIWVVWHHLVKVKSHIATVFLPSRNSNVFSHLILTNNNRRWMVFFHLLMRERNK